MRKIGAFVAIAALAAGIVAPSPSAAFGLRIGPFHLGLPLPRPFFRFRHRTARHRAVHTAAIGSDEVERGRGQSVPSLAVALLYPGFALPALYDEIFWPMSAPRGSSSRWPFGYETIFRAAFAKARPDARRCQQIDRATVIVDRITAEIRPNRAQLQLLQKLGDALGTAAGYLQKSCPSEIPPQPVARLKFMQLQIEPLSMALDIVRPPLQQFEQSLNGSQRARFAARLRTPSVAAAACGTTPTTIDWPVDRIDQSVQPNTAQRGAIAAIKKVFASAANDLDAHCSSPLPLSPLARLEATQSRLDAAWRAELDIQVALSNLETRLSDQQRIRFNAIDLAAAR
jgi:LTXXQ motif family protein